jgi:protein gp37
MLRYGHDPHAVVRGKSVWHDVDKWDDAAWVARERRRVFVCPWSDFWIEEADGWREDALAIITRCTNLEFIVPSKRLERATAWMADQVWPANLWQLASVSVQSDANRLLDHLAVIPAAVRGVSYEPALGPVDFTPWLPELDWLVMGCESASHTTPGRPAEFDWFRAARDQCQEHGVACYLKQVAVDGRLVHEPELDGRQWLEFPRPRKSFAVTTDGTPLSAADYGQAFIFGRQVR